MPGEVGENRIEMQSTMRGLQTTLSRSERCSTRESGRPDNLELYERWGKERRISKRESGCLGGALGDVRGAGEADTVRGVWCHERTNWNSNRGGRTL